MILFQLSKQMGGVVKGLDKVMQSMDLQKVKGYDHDFTSFLQLQIPALLWAFPIIRLDYYLKCNLVYFEISLILVFRSLQQCQSLKIYLKISTLTLKLWTPP